VSEICELCGRLLEGDHSECRALEARLKAEWDSKREELCVRYRLRKITKENRVQFETVLRSTHAALELEDDHPWSEERGLEAETYWFIPLGWIGSKGQIVDKQTGSVTTLGSAFDLDLCLWAYELGALASPCTLVIDQIHDRALTVELLGKLDNRSPFNPVPVQGTDAAGEPRWLDATLLAEAPIRIDAESLWFALPALRQGVDSRAFVMHIEPVRRAG
jgi:hypothetical protein